MGFWQLTVPTSPDTSEGFTNFLWEQGALGVVEEGGPAEPPRVRAFFPDSASSTGLVAGVAAYAAELRALGFATAPASVDGRSLAPLLHGEKIESWRSVALVEHRGPVRQLTDPDMPGLRGGNPPTYEAIRMQRGLYVEYMTGEKEYHDFATDPDELRNTFASLPAEQKAALHATLDAVQNCHDAKSCEAAERVGRTAMRN